jgi:hypothetical protein
MAKGSGGENLYHKPRHIQLASDNLWLIKREVIRDLHEEATATSEELN